MDAESEDFFVLQDVVDGAMRADLPNEALRNHADEHRTQQEGKDAEVQHTAHCAGGVDRVDRGDDQVTGERRLDRILCGLLVPGSRRP